ncbi:MAG: ribonuclease III [Armatimonadetes bacterium]|nr:ribonuclease III [Armatimonadota bacterium]
MPDTTRVRTALTHRSASDSVSGSNERLEFLGDALLSAFVARFLLEALPPETDEGTLTRGRARIVRRETLADAARRLGIAERLMMGAGEIADNRQTGDSPLADAYEALIGAVFLDDGYDAAEAFVRSTLAEILAQVAASPEAFAPDAKTTLQIRLQAAGKGLPRYEIIEETGTGQHIVFTAVVFAGGSDEPLGTGRGANKRAAQTEAARAALDGQMQTTNAG